LVGPCLAAYFGFYKISVGIVGFKAVEARFGAVGVNEVGAVGYEAAIVEDIVKI